MRYYGYAYMQLGYLLDKKIEKKKIRKEKLLLLFLLLFDHQGNSMTKNQGTLFPLKTWDNMVFLLFIYLFIFWEGGRGCWMETFGRNLFGLFGLFLPNAPGFSECCGCFLFPSVCKLPPIKTCRRLIFLSFTLSVFYWSLDVIILHLCQREIET